MPRWKPWDLASRVGTVDRLSNGRTIMGVGLGALHDGWLAFEADEGRKTRAQKLDEGLAVYDGLMRGQPFTFEGTHYNVRPTGSSRPTHRFSATASGVGRRRAHDRPRASTVARTGARWDGLLPQVIAPEGRSKPDGLEAFHDVTSVVRRMRTEAGLLGGTTT